MRESLRRSVEHGVLVADPASGSFRFRHALLAEVIYATILPGEREELHAARRAALAVQRLHRPARPRPTGRRRATCRCSQPRSKRPAGGGGVRPGRSSRAPRAGPQAVGRRSGAAELAGVDLAGCSWAAELASQAGAAPAVELARRAIDLVEERDPLGAARLYERLGRYLHESGRTDAALSAFERVVEFVPAQPPSARRAEALAALAHGLMLAWRFDESLAICERALALARRSGSRTRSSFGHS